MSNIVPASRLMQGSMSKTDLLLRCQYWASGMVTLPKSKAVYPLRFGSAFHKTMEIHLKSKGHEVPDLKAIAAQYEIEVPRLKDYYERGKRFIDDFIRTNFPGSVTIYIEEKLAYNPFTDAMRFLQSDKERDYSGILPGEFPGTGDIIIVPENEDWFCTLDWKTGQSNYDPQEKQMLYNGQLASLSLAMSRFLNRNKVQVWIVRIDDEFVEDVPGVVIKKNSKDKPWLYAEDLETHRKKLARALTGARSPNPVMYPGGHCHELYCSALSVCPAHAGPMALRDELHGELDAERKMMLFERVMAAKKMIEKMEDWFKEEISRNGPFQRENGKWAMIQAETRENLSKASIIRALGAEEGQAVIQQLRDGGCIEESSYEKVVYRNDPSARK